MDQSNLNEKLFRRNLKKGKIFAIHHLTRRVRLLRKKLGTKQQVEKNIRKADRFEKEIGFIKDFDVDIVLNKLQSEPDLLGKSVNMDSVTDIEERAFARLISSKPIQNIFNKNGGKTKKKHEIPLRQQKLVDNVSTSNLERLQPESTMDTAPLTQTPGSSGSDEEINNSLSEDSCHSSDGEETTILERTATSLFVESLSSLSKDENTRKTKRNSLKKEPQKASNRLGQRARQRLWHEKYGRNARHMKTNGKVDKKDLGGKSKFSSRKIKPNRELRSKQPKQEAASSHPSWEASKRLKSQQNISLTQFQGKKIIFED